MSEVGNVRMSEVGSARMPEVRSARMSEVGSARMSEVGNVAAFLCSDLASGITGEITYVDGGFNTAAMSIEEYID